MNLYSLKAEFREYLLSQGVFSLTSSESKDFDTIDIFTYEDEFKDFVLENYDIELDSSNSDISELYDLEVQNGKFVSSDLSDDETNFMLDMVNSIIQDDEFVENIDEYVANEDDENSMLVSLSNLFKNKGLIDNNDISDSKETPSNASISNASNANFNGISNKNYNNINKNTVAQDGTTDYSKMNTDELEKAYSEKQADISNQNQALNSTISQNRDDIAKAKEEYDLAIGQDNIDPFLLESRNQNLSEITLTDNTISELSANIASFDVKISSLDSQISIIDGSIASLNSTLSSFASVSDEEAKEQIQQKTSQIQGQIEQLTSQKEALSAQKASLEEQKSASELSLSENTSKKQELENAKLQIESQILQVCNENTKVALENYNKARTNADIALENAKNVLTSEKDKLSEISSYLNSAISKDIEEEYSYSNKSEIFKENEGYSLVKGDDNTNMSHSVIVPNNLDETKEAPVILYLHGGGGSERSLYNQIMQNYDVPEGFNGYIICPTANRSDWAKPGVAEDIDEILTKFSESHNIDMDNVVVVGHSMGGTGALHLADNKIFKDENGVKFSRAAALTGYPAIDKEYDIPVALWADSTSVDCLENHNLNMKQDDRYYDLVGQAHTQIDNIAFNLDEDNDGKSDLIEWLFNEE